MKTMESGMSFDHSTITHYKEEMYGPNFCGNKMRPHERSTFWPADVNCSACLARYHAYPKTKPRTVKKVTVLQDSGEWDVL